MKSPRLLFITVLLQFVLGVPFFASGQNIQEELELHDLRIAENGIFKKTGGDPYIIFPTVDQNICSSKGGMFSIKFLPELKKPLLLEVFWRTEILGFGEESKVFFTAYPQQNGASNHFIVPLDNIATFSQIRLDFPSYLEEDFTIEEYDIVSLDASSPNAETISVFRTLTMDEALNPYIITPYLLKTVNHGFQRLSHDKGFLIFWVLLISTLLYLIRLSSKRGHL